METTTQEQPQEPQPGIRRLYRSRDDRVIGGVFGGLGRHFGVDPVILRIGGVVLAFLGGLSVVGYLAALVFVPKEPLEGIPDGPPSTDRTGPLAVVGALVLLIVAWPLILGTGLVALAIGLPLLGLAVAGLFVWWLISGDAMDGQPADIARRALLGAAVLMASAAVFAGGAWATGVGGGDIAAGLVIASGVMLIIGAFAGGLRLLIVPALALALGTGVVAAADIDLRGGIGEEQYRPAVAGEIRDAYELGMGQLIVDLRGTELGDGDTPVRVRLGIGEAMLVVPRDVCVSSTAQVGMGEVRIFGRDSAGVDVSFEDRREAPAGVRRIVVDAEVGVGSFAVRHTRPDEFGPPELPPLPGFRGVSDDGRNGACSRA